jgi:hypothetical protein
LHKNCDSPNEAAKPTRLESTGGHCGASFLRETGRKREAKALDKEAYARFGPDP